MNDFTKDELCLIVDALTSLSFEERDKGESVLLRSKVLSMIDNYCEHEKILEIRDVDFVKVCYEC